MNPYYRQIINWLDYASRFNQLWNFLTFMGSNGKLIGVMDHSTIVKPFLERKIAIFPVNAYFNYFFILYISNIYSNFSKKNLEKCNPNIT